MSKIYHPFTDSEKIKFIQSNFYINLNNINTIFIHSTSIDGVVQFDDNYIRFNHPRKEIFHQVSKKELHIVNREGYSKFKQFEIEINIYNKLNGSNILIYNIVYNNISDIIINTFGNNIKNVLIGSIFNYLYLNFEVNIDYSIEAETYSKYKSIYDKLENYYFENDSYIDEIYELIINRKDIEGFISDTLFQNNLINLANKYLINLKTDLDINKYNIIDYYYWNGYTVSEIFKLPPDLHYINLGKIQYLINKDICVINWISIDIITEFLKQLQQKFSNISLFYYGKCGMLNDTQNLGNIVHPTICTEMLDSKLVLENKFNLGSPIIIDNVLSPIIEDDLYLNRANELCIDGVEMELYQIIRSIDKSKINKYYLGYYVSDKPYNGFKLNNKFSLLSARLKIAKIFDKLIVENTI